MVRGSKDKPSELEIKGEAEAPGETGRVTPDAQTDFVGLMKDYGVAEKAAETVGKFIAETGTADVFSDPRQLAERMANFPRHIPPVTRANILDHWTAINKIPYPEEVREEAEMPAEDLKLKRSGKSDEKYSVDTETGAIKVASTSEKTALTWDEAEKLSSKIKKDIEVREKKEGKAEKGQQEPPFIIDTEGNWQLNPKAKIGGMELLAFEAVKKSQERGERLDPFEVMTQRAKDIEMIRSVFGGGGSRAFDSIDDFIKLKNLLGADDDVKALLSGILKKVSEGEGKGETEEVRGLRDELRSLREDLQRKELEKRDDQLKTLSTQLSSLESKLEKATTEARAKDEYGIMSEALREISSARRDIVGTVQGFIGKRPTPLTETAKKEITEAISEEAKEKAEVEKLAEEIFYEHK